MQLSLSQQRSIQTTGRLKQTGWGHINIVHVVYDDSWTCYRCQHSIKKKRERKTKTFSFLVNSMAVWKKNKCVDRYSILSFILAFTSTNLYVLALFIKHWIIISISNCLAHGNYHFCFQRNKTVAWHLI